MLKEFIHRHFRCPFEILGRQQKLILDVELTTDTTKAFWLARDAFQKFHSNTKLFAITFHLPEVVFESCNNFEKLRKELVPYQAAILTAELDFRLFPFLAYHANNYKDSKLQVQGLLTKDPGKPDFALLIHHTMLAQKFGIPKKFQDISKWITYHINKAIRQTSDENTLILGFDGKPLMTIATSGVILDSDERHLSDSIKNKNSFSIVRSPLYPKKIGRYAHATEIVITRQADFHKLSTLDRQKIRALSNKILKSIGIPIKDILDDKQPGGLWTPKQETKNCPLTK